MHVTVLIVAGGKGERLGAGQPKQFLDMGDGRTMLDTAVAAFLACPEIAEVVVAVPRGWTDRVAAGARVRVIEGGARRQDSMANAFAATSGATDVVLVHDAARPFVSRGVILRTIAAAAEHGAAIPALPAHDTVKRTAGAGGGRRVRETLPRAEIMFAQTPQGFRRELLARALAASNEDVTDEAMLAERAGIPVAVVAGEAGNVKITTADDLVRARQGRTETEPMRIGTGYDLHRLVAGRPLILAGVRIPFASGLLGHSDADIVCHAVTDAALGAAAAGDIGRMFPDTDPQWKDADSLALLRAAIQRVRESGYVVANADVTVIAQQPKLLPFIDQMRANLAGALGVELSQVSVKGKTNEGVDAAGRGEAMACHAVVLLTAVGTTA